MSKLKKALALMLSLCLLASGSLALAEATAEPTTGDVTQAVPTTLQLADTDVVARVGGTDITGADVKTQYTNLVNYYGEPDASTLELYYALAMQQAVTVKLISITATENGLDQYTEEEINALNAESDASWQSALDSYVQSQAGITDASTEEEKTAAYAQAETYYNGLGYNPEMLRANYLENSTFERVQAFVTKDVTVTDEDIQARYDENVARDKALYENDLDGYESQLMMFQYQMATETPWYHPAGYRFVKHILLPIDSELLSAYTDVTARLEEQMESEGEAAEGTTVEAVEPQADEAAAAEATADPANTPEPTQEPVSPADVDTAKANILASIQDKTTEIYDKIAAGSDFNELITEYGVNADGTASDPGMASASYPNGYEVSTASASYVPEFVEAAFSVDNIGDVSAPYISEFGVHIVRYMADVPAGPVELTDALKDTLRTTLQTEKNNAAMNAWQSAASVEYTGILKSVEQLQSEEIADTTDEDTAIAPEAVEETAASDAVAEEPTAAPAE